MNWTKAMAYFIVFLMVFSVLGAIGSSFFSDDEREKEYNSFNFINMGSQWLLKIGDKDYYFQYLPEELENITSPGVDLNVPRIYLAYKPDDTINFDKAFNSIGYVLYHHQETILQKACTVEEGCPDIPIIDCQEKAGIVVVSGEEDSYTQDGKCLIITAVDNQELEKLTERLMYNLLKVMK